jgi:D-alanyl-D-alanine dipeptidase
VLIAFLLAALNPPPDGFVDLQRAVPGVVLEIRYHTKDNFTGAPLPGYREPGAWMLKAPAEALARVQAALQKDGLSLLVYDAYRPLRGTLAMVAWAERTGHVALLDAGYIARKSGHNHGHTVDLTIVDQTTKQPLDMGTPWDALSEASNTMRATGKALQNRLLLKKAMEAEGFKPYLREWWHFTFPMQGTVARDVPYGDSEPHEAKQ